MRLLEETGARRARVEMIPLIDTMFLLLAFFVVAMLSMDFVRGLPVALPQAATSEPLEREPLRVALARDGSLSLGGRRVALEALADAVREHRAAPGAAERPLLLAGDEGVPLGRALAVLDALRRAGVEELRFQTRPEPSS